VVHHWEGHTGRPPGERRQLDEATVQDEVSNRCRMPAVSVATHSAPVVGDETTAGSSCALLAECASATSFYDLVDTIICQPACMTDTAFLRSDELPGDTAIGYLHADGLRTKTLHMPVCGCGDGWLYTTATDMLRSWRALLDGRIVQSNTVELTVTPHGTKPCGTPYGLGFSPPMARGQSPINSPQSLQPESLSLGGCCFLAAFAGG
jgi:hypothetical protein